MTDQPASTAPAVAAHPLVQGRCPACGWTTLFLGSGGYLTCSRIDCPQPDAATEVIADFWDARQHGAFTFCPQEVGHVTMTAFAQKISEKRTALAQRDEAAEYANEQKQRADQLAATLDAALTCMELHWARSDFHGPADEAVTPEHFKNWRNALDQNRRQS
ncbi:DUF6085 family protein [Streptomyces canus]|uniref:DUF6085 family protein n=1 Tax=Streptomyces canus TaxID=58343 RepID=UPI003409116C